MFYKYSKWPQIALLGILALLVFGAYFKILRAEFVYDDFAFIVNNKAIQTLTPLSKFLTDPNIFTGAQENDSGGRNWRPVSSLVFALEYKIFGANSFGFHLISVLLHLINAILIYFLARALLKKELLALAIASLWALHPVLTEAVSWASNQSSLIFFLFFILSILALLKEKFHSSYALFALSLLSKETALGGIFIIAFVFFAFLKAKWKQFIPFAATAIVYFIARFAIVGGVGDHALRGSFWQNLLLAPAVFWKYLTLSVWPFNLLLDYSNYAAPSGIFDIRVILGLSAIALIGALIWQSFKKSRPEIGLGAIWFVAFLIPVLQIIPFQDVIGERFLYAPLAGFFFVVVLGFERFSEFIKLKFGFNAKTAGSVFLKIIVALFLLLTLNRNNDWLNSQNLWESVLKVDGRNEKALQNLSAYYIQKGDGKKAVKFSEELLNVNSENRVGYLHLAIGKIMEGSYEEGEAELLRLIEKYPDFEEAKLNLSILYQRLGRGDSFINSVIDAPAVEGNIVNSGIAGQVVLLGGGPYEYEASLEIFKRSDQSKPVMSVRTHGDGTFQIPLRPGDYILKPFDPDGPIAPVKSSYNFAIGSGQWLQVKVEYE